MSLCLLAVISTLQLVGFPNYIQQVDDCIAAVLLLVCCCLRVCSLVLLVWVYQVVWHLELAYLLLMCLHVLTNGWDGSGLTTMVVNDWVIMLQSRCAGDVKWIYRFFAGGANTLPTFQILNILLVLGWCVLILMIIVVSILNRSIVTVNIMTLIVRVCLVDGPTERGMVLELKCGWMLILLQHIRW